MASPLKRNENVADNKTVYKDLQVGIDGILLLCFKFGPQEKTID